MQRSRASLQPNLVLVSSDLSFPGTTMMNKLVSAFVVLLVAASVSSFAPAAFAPRASTSLDIFGGGKKKPAAGGDKKGGKDLNVFGGRGSRITVREDEDNAMWVEGDDGNRESVYGKGNKGKGK